MEPLLPGVNDAVLLSAQGARAAPFAPCAGLADECRVFLGTEDGSGDAKLNKMKPTLHYADENNVPGSAGSRGSPERRREPSSELLNADSNPECDIEGIPELPLDGGMPGTVTVLEAEGGGRVYLVGTAHFSRESQDDVSRVIREVNPHVVMVELCEQRTNILLVDEETILREAKDINLHKIRSTIAKTGVFNGLMYILLLNMSAQLTRELGMAPGGEFRRALAEAKKLPNCVVQLGDRGIDVTLQRALASLSWPQSARLVWHLLTSDTSISAEDVEKCKQKKMLEQMLEEMAEEFPTLKRVFVEERDMYLCHSLQLAARQIRDEPCRIVGVVGIGHVEGIGRLWGKVRPQDIPPLLRIPPPALSTRVLRAGVKLACAGAVVYVGYRLASRLRVQDWFL